MSDNNSHDNPFNQIVLANPICDYSPHDSYDYVPNTDILQYDSPNSALPVHNTNHNMPIDPIFLVLIRYSMTHRAPTSLRNFVFHVPYPLTDSVSYDKFTKTLSCMFP